MHASSGNSLRTGKLSGNSLRFRMIPASLRGFGSRPPSGFNGLRPIPCSSGNREFSVPEQGTRPAEQGICRVQRRPAEPRKCKSAGLAKRRWDDRCGETAGSWRKFLISNGLHPGGFVLPKPRSGVRSFSPGRRRCCADAPTTSRRRDRAAEPRHARRSRCPLIGLSHRNMTI